MANKRALITLTPDEQRSFLVHGKTVYIASNGKDGYPHLIAMWYAVDGDTVLMTTFRKSQKVKNLERDPRCSLLLQEGATYDKLKGLFLRGVCEIVDDEQTTLRTLAKVGARMAGAPEISLDDVPAPMRAQAKKRVTLRFHAKKVASWDHAKLAGAY